MNNAVETEDQESDGMSDDESSSEKFKIEPEPAKKPVMIKLLRS